MPWIMRYSSTAIDSSTAISRVVIGDSAIRAHHIQKSWLLVACVSPGVVVLDVLRALLSTLTHRWAGCQAGTHSPKCLTFILR
ncbi:hypothetical protein AVEN_154556-1 [Araneus ventricosus]|uniref:Uncharacterized protein n=1 Tax=Araneus ventricosus TaxID=182803 RepID=A0A4Y2MH29_ARAVE|nr:hypothetical protein AVEN_154556-1 [Araneus ventricosus]